MALETGTPTIVAIAAICISLLGLVWQYFGVLLGLRKEISDSAKEIREETSKIEKELIKIINDQGNRLTRSETKMELFWNAIGGVVTSLIKQPVHFRKDELMDRLMHLDTVQQLSVDELFQLKVILKSELVDLKENKEDKSLAYALALAYIDQILFDKGYIGGNT